MTVFIVILEDNRKPIWLLPFIAIAWSNLHGIVYPVWMLILGAYLMEDMLHRIFHFGKKETDKRLWRYLPISMLCVLATPHGIDLLQVPFDTPPFQPMYIDELKRPEIPDLFVFDFCSPPRAFASMRHVLLITSAVCALTLLARRQMRISHIVLAGGAIYLLTMHVRFTYEALLLLLPVLRRGVRMLVGLSDGPFFKQCAWILALASVLLPLMAFGHVLQNNRPAYPFSSSGLPCGVAAFLNRVNTSGRILNDPSTGGYMQWALKPGYTIFMDLQMSIFRDEDYFFSRNAAVDPDLLTIFIETYDPSFLSISTNNIRFVPDVLNKTKFSHFVPVAVDDVEVLFVNRLHHPDMAVDYEMKHIDPFRMTNMDFGLLDDRQLEPVRKELLRMVETSAQSLIVNKALCDLFLFKGYFPGAERHAERIRNEYPEKPEGYALTAEIFMKQKRYREAAKQGRIALKKAGRFPERSIYMTLSTCLMELHQFEAAYDLLLRYVNPFTGNASEEEVGALYMAAQASGRTKQAEILKEIRDLLISAHARSENKDARSGE